MVKENKAANPPNVGVLGAQAVMLKARYCPNLIQQFGSRHWLMNSLYFKLLGVTVANLAERHNTTKSGIASRIRGIIPSWASVER